MPTIHTKAATLLNSVESCNLEQIKGVVGVLLAYAGRQVSSLQNESLHELLKVYPHLGDIVTSTKPTISTHAINTACAELSLEMSTFRLIHQQYRQIKLRSKRHLYQTIAKEAFEKSSARARSRLKGEIRHDEEWNKILPAETIRFDARDMHPVSWDEPTYPAPDAWKYFRIYSEAETGMPDLRASFPRVQASIWAQKARKSLHLVQAVLHSLKKSGTSNSKVQSGITSFENSAKGILAGMKEVRE